MKGLSLQSSNCWTPSTYGAIVRFVLCLSVPGVIGYPFPTEINDNKDNTSLSRCFETYKALSEEKLTKYVDASGKPGSGIYGINDMWFGSFGECNKMSKSRYCLAFFNAVVSLGGKQTQALFPLQLGICMPDMCSEDDVVSNLDFFLRNVSKLPVRQLSTKRFGVKVECAEDPDYTAGVVITIILCGIICGLCILGTILEGLENLSKSNEKLNKFVKSDELQMGKDTNEGTPLLLDKKDVACDTQTSAVSLYDIFNCFSLVRNANFILNTNVGKSDLTYLHGIRVLSLFWIILFHVAVFMQPEMPVDNHLSESLFFRRRSAMVIMYGSMGVNTFFLLSGLLLVYVNLHKLEKSKGRMNWIRFYFHRFWRLTPSYAFAILFITKFRPFIGDGPRAYALRDTSACSDYWWTNLLYISNFYPSDVMEGCIVQTWYLSADMQLFVASPILLLVLTRFGYRRFFSFATLLILASMIATAVVTGTKDFYPVIPAVTREASDEYHYGFSEYVYSKPYSRIPAYVIGMVLGCIIFRNFGAKLQLRWYWALFLWCISIGTALAVVYGPHSALKTDPHVWTKGEKVTYATLSWFLWSMCVAWVIFACQYGYAGLVKSILSEKFWIPLSRINYAAFILHVDVQKIVLWSIQAPVHFTTFTFINMYIVSLVLSYASAFVFTLMVELPFANLEALFMNKTRRK